jgi:hypothetical protein
MMIERKFAVMTATLAMATLWTGTALAVPTAAQNCAAAKLKAAGKYHFCRVKADRKVVLRGGLPNYEFCDTVLSTKWTRAETAFGMSCPTFNDLEERKAEVTIPELELWQRLWGTPLCSDGTKNGSEQCDGLDLGGASCNSLGYTMGGTLGCTAACQYDISPCCQGDSQDGPATGQTTCWNTAGTVIPCAGTGHDGDVQAGAALAYADNGDGTVTDLNTGLMWEKKSDDGSIHDKDTTYTWDDAFAVHVAGLNSGTFAGHADWRVPNVKELVSIVNYAIPYPGPIVDAAFNTGCAPVCTVTTCSCTQPQPYWSSTTYPGSPNFAWFVYFFDGGTVPNTKITTYSVRGVRGGL